MPCNDHRLGEMRSLAYHQAIAEKLRQQPNLLEKVCQRLTTQIANPRSYAEGYWLQKWLEELERPHEELLAFMVEHSERADQMRQSTPFAGILKPAERWAIFRRVREEWLRELEAI